LTLKNLSFDDILGKQPPSERGRGRRCHLVHQGVQWIASLIAGVHQKSYHPGSGHFKYNLLGTVNSKMVKTGNRLHFQAESKSAVDAAGTSQCSQAVQLPLDDHQRPDRSL
jgi:hypothetical protein